jgi:ferredoxin-NADP reductase
MLEPNRLVTALRTRESVAERTTTFYFDKPSGFEFTAGQTIDLTLIDPPHTDAEGDSRTFSIASAPQESRIAIAAMPLGTAVQLDGPMGGFTLDETAIDPVVFVAGGIGITPFRSMIVDVHMRRLRRELWLFYANRRPEDAAFLHEMRALSAVMPAFHVVATVTAPEGIDASWTGERGRLDLPMVRRWLPDLQVPTYYIAGPPDMVAAFHRLLVGAGVSRRSVRVEEFTGY